jgi:cytochrome P450
MVRRDKYAYQLKTLRIPGSITAAADFDAHKKRRELLTPLFSKRNVVQLEPMVAKKVEQLCQLISKHAADETPMNLSNALFAFSNE